MSPRIEVSLSRWPAVRRLLTVVALGLIPAMLEAQSRPRRGRGAAARDTVRDTVRDARPRSGRADPGRRVDPSSGPIRVLVARPTDRSVTLNVLTDRDTELRIAYGSDSARLTRTIGATRVAAGVPTEITIRDLVPNRRYAYRVYWRQGGIEERTEPLAHWQTQRAIGDPFVFTVQGDSHPERVGRMFDPALYQRTLERVRLATPDFHVLLGDDFSIEQLISRRALTAESVNAVYATQRTFLDAVARSTPIIPVNGNHEEAGRFLLDGTPTSAPVLAGLARNRFFSPPEPDGFYTGDTVAIPHLGLPRDYFAWHWGNALFVVIDPYWHTPPTSANLRPQSVEARGNAMQAAGVGRDLWQMTLGDEQYAWLDRTLRSSTARWKFVFAHHVLGTGRGGVELADSHEWGGQDRRGTNQFRQFRPTWALPIHQLFVATGVTVFFQGHDHLFARQEKDGVIYQSTPNPADPTYTAFNRDAYRSGDVLPNSGHLRVGVHADHVQVEYIRSFLPQHVDSAHVDGQTAFTYRIRQ